MRSNRIPFLIPSLVIAACATITAAAALIQGNQTLTGQAALGDAKTDAPGVRRKIVAADMPRPFTAVSPGVGPRVVPWPEGAGPKAPEGFKVEKFATGLSGPRMAAVAPNGDVFIAESGAGRISILRDTDGDGKSDRSEVYAEGLNRPFGMAFYPAGRSPEWLYVATIQSVVRMPYKPGELKPAGTLETIISDLPPANGHWTRDIAFSKDGKKLYVACGSGSDVNLDASVLEDGRAEIREYSPEGSGRRTYASGIRNPVGIAVHPQTGQLWASVNERENMGDHVPPDYITRVKEGGFYGWPWYYIGPNEDPRHAGKHPELKEKTIVPDVLVQTHSASMAMCFYTGSKFPREYRNDGFAAFRGSSGRTGKTGYKIVRVPCKNGVPTGEYEDFVTGFVIDDVQVHGRPVGVTSAPDGSLFFTDDGAGTVWRVSYVK